jgi:hypothetical protein
VWEATDTRVTQTRILSTQRLFVPACPAPSNAMLRAQAAYVPRRQPSPCLDAFAGRRRHLRASESLFASNRMVSMPPIWGRTSCAAKPLLLNACRVCVVRRQLLQHSGLSLTSPIESQAEGQHKPVSVSEVWQPRSRSQGGLLQAAWITSQTLTPASLTSGLTNAQSCMVAQARYQSSQIRTGQNTPCHFQGRFIPAATCLSAPVCH